MNPRTVYSEPEKLAIIRRKGEMKDYNSRQLLELGSIRSFEGFSSQDIAAIQTEMNSITDDMNRRILEMFRRRTEAKIEGLNDDLAGNTSKYGDRCQFFAKENDTMNQKID